MERDLREGDDPAVFVASVYCNSGQCTHDISVARRAFAGHVGTQLVVQRRCCGGEEFYIQIDQGSVRELLGHAFREEALHQRGDLCRANCLMCIIHTEGDANPIVVRQVNRMQG